MTGNESKADMAISAGGGKLQTQERENKRTESARKRPGVSICVPAYNNPEEVARLFDSIWSQTFSDYKVILSDDSTDNRIEEAMNRLEETQREKVTYIHNPKPLGHIFNWNKALSLAKGKYVKIMFSDDWFTGPESLEKMVSLLEDNPDAGMAFCGTMQVSSKTSYARAAGKEYTDRLKRDYRNLFLGNEIGAPSAVIYRNTDVRFDEASNWASDMFLYFEILSVNPVFAFTREPLISIGIHESQYTEMFQEKDIRKFQDRFLMYQKYGLQSQEACRKEMLHMTVVFKQGWKTAKECGATGGEYLTERLRWFWKNTVLGYWNGLKHKLPPGK